MLLIINKKKIIIIVFSCIAIIGIMVYFMIGNPFVFINNQKLEKSIKNINEETILLNDIVPFDWEIVYTFEPYQSKAEIEKIIGFKSADIKANNINEGMVHLLFVNHNKVVASILGYSSNLGYSVSLESKKEKKITFADNARFQISKMNGITYLTYIK